MRLLLSRLLRPVVLLLLLLVGTAASLSAQRGCDTTRAAIPTVKADLGAQALDGPLPFNIRFNLRVPVPMLITAPDSVFQPDFLLLVYGPATLARTSNGGSFAIAEPIGGDTIGLRDYVQSKEVIFAVEPLSPGRRYYFDFTVSGIWKDKDRTPQRRTHTVRLSGTPKTDLANHFDADLGLIRSSRAEYVGLGSNAHFYVVPIHANECTSDYEGLDHVLKRVSVFGGLSLVKLHSEAEVDHLFSGGAPVFGIGLNRLPYLNPLRFNVGVIGLKQDADNPLVTRERRKWDPFVSAAVDIQLKSFIGPLTGLAAGLR